MANKTFRTLALVLALILCLSYLPIGVYAAPSSDSTSRNWTYAYYLGQEYLGNAPGKPQKPDPVGYGFQGVITSLTFRDDAGKSWTFHWNSEANGEWRITGSNVSKSTATDWPKVTDGSHYIGYCGDKAYEFTLSLDGKAADWTYADDSSSHANWFYYIRFIRVYVINVYYENDTGTILYNGIRYATQKPLVREFEFLYPNGDIIDDSEYEDGDYTDPITLLPRDYLTEDMKNQGYEVRYATDANGNDVLRNGVTISLLGDNILNVYCALIPPATENYSVIHTYYTDDTYDGSINGGLLEVEEGADFSELVESIQKKSDYQDQVYTYTNYQIDPSGNIIILIYIRETPEPTEPDPMGLDPTEIDPTELDPTEPWEDIPDDDVPLVDVPKTGDPIFIYIALIIVSGVGLLALIVSTKKKY